MTKYEIEMKNKKQALADFLDVEEKNIEYNDESEVFYYDDCEYMVLTEYEADSKAEKEIRNSLWAFVPSFILEHTQFYDNSTSDEDEAFIKCLSEMQAKMCELCNPIIIALIKDVDDFVQDAINEDGRGNFISLYDGEENEQNGFYIYRIY